MIAASTVILALLLVHLYEIITSTEHWPFSPYPMYSELVSGQASTSIALVGVKRNRQEFSMDAAWQRKTFTRMASRSSESRHGALRTCYQSYRADKRAGSKRQDLAGVRLYEETWTVDDAGRPKRLARKLVDQYMRPSSATKPSRRAKRAAH